VRPELRTLVVMEARRKDVGYGGSESRVATSTLDNLDLLMEVVGPLLLFDFMVIRIIS
jgi:hypothetical protein